MNFDCNKTEEIISTLLYFLREEHLCSMWQIPIVQAAQTFSIPNTPVQSHREFIHIMGKYLQHLSERNVIPISVSHEKESRIKVVHYLNQYYESEGGRGFEAAYLDAKQLNCNGIQMVINKVTEIFILVAQHQYKQYLFQSLIIPDDCNLKQDLVKSIFHRYSAFLSEDILKRSPDMFIYNIEGLIHMILSCEETIHRMLKNQ